MPGLRVHDVVLAIVYAYSSCTQVCIAYANNAKNNGEIGERGRVVSYNAYIFVT